MVSWTRERNSVEVKDLMNGSQRLISTPRLSIINVQTQQIFTYEIQRKSMMQTQSGEAAAPATSASMREEVADVGIIAQKDLWNESMKKWQKACRKTVATTVIVATILQREASQWMAKVAAWIRREGKSAGIAPQTEVQLQAWFAQVDQAVASVKNRAQPLLAAHLVSLAGTNASEAEDVTVEDLAKAIAGVQKIVAWIDYHQAEVEAERAEKLEEEAQLAVAKAKAKVIIPGKSEAAVVEAKQRVAKTRQEKRKRRKQKRLHKLEEQSSKQRQRCCVEKFP
jgi:hypothetical protein